MPIYEYSCSHCEYKFEASRPMNDHENAWCPKCGQKADWRPSVFNFSFGWRLKDECHEVGGPKYEYEKDV